MVFCNVDSRGYSHPNDKSHNPYFNRWFSAIAEILQMSSEEGHHNPYFNRWFSAMKKKN